MPPAWTTLLTALSAAMEPAEVAVAGGEAVRLVEELRRLAGRQVWAGVERTYAELLARGVEIPADVHVAAADAARARGDLGDEQARLRAALALGPDRRVTERLQRIEADCAPVELAGRPGKGLALIPQTLPFDPVQRAAVEAAVAEVEATGSFTGWLPRGAYRFAEHPFVVEPGVVVRIDVQSRGRVPATDAQDPPREQR